VRLFGTVSHDLIARNFPSPQGEGFPPSPKGTLKVTWHSRNPEDKTIYSSGEAKNLVFGHELDVLVFIEGQMINSYE